MAGNLKLKNPKQTITVKPEKDRMAQNVGGKDHMQAKKQNLGGKPATSGGKSKGPKHKSARY